MSVGQRFHAWSRHHPTLAPLSLALGGLGLSFAVPWAAGSLAHLLGFGTDAAMQAGLPASLGAQVQGAPNASAALLKVLSNARAAGATGTSAQVLSNAGLGSTTALYQGARFPFSQMHPGWAALGSQAGHQGMQQGLDYGIGAMNPPEPPAPNLSPWHMDFGAPQVDEGTLRQLYALLQSGGYQ